VDDALFVRGFKGLSDLPRDWDGFVWGNRTASDAIGQRFTIDEFKYEGAEGPAEAGPPSSGEESAVPTSRP